MPMAASTDAAQALSPGADGRHATFCRNCEAFCGLEVEVKDGKAVKIQPDRLNPHSRGHACIKGTAALGLVYDDDRITRPMRRSGSPGSFVEVEWDEALDDIAERLSVILGEGGGDSVANYVGNPASFNTGTQFAIGQFLAHFGIWKTFSSATQDATSRLAASRQLYGNGYRLAVPDLPRCDFLMIFGANPLASHGSVLTAPRMIEDLDAIARRGRVIVFDPRRTETAARYEHVSVYPDTDIWLMMAMINAIFGAGVENGEAMTVLTRGGDELRAAVSSVTPEIAARYCGVPAATIRDLALKFAASPRAAAYGRVGICRGRFAMLANVLLDTLNIIAGKFGVEGGWVFSDGIVDLAAMEPSCIDFKQTRFGSRPYVGGFLHFSQLLDEILTAGEGRVRALLMQAGNFVLSAPGGERTIEALGALDLFVSNDLYMNETNRFADYILPGTSFLERSDVPLIGLGHMVRPSIQFTQPVIEPVDSCRDEAHTYNQLAARIHTRLSEHPGKSGYDAGDAPVCDTLAMIDALLRSSGKTIDLGNGAETVSLDLLKAHPHGIMLADNIDCSSSMGKIAHEDGLVHLWSPAMAEEMERARTALPPERGELRLFGLRRYQTMNSWMHNVERLARTTKPVLLMHPEDASFRGIIDNDLVEIITPSGCLEVPVKVTDQVVEGSVCYPHGYGHEGGWQRANVAGGSNVNILADVYAGDLVSASSHLDGILVEVRRIGGDLR